MTLLDIPLSALQRITGPRRMAYFFILPNMLIFSIFYPAADGHEFLYWLHERAIHAAGKP